MRVSFYYFAKWKDSSSMQILIKYCELISRFSLRKSSLKDLIFILYKTSL